MITFVFMQKYASDVVIVGAGLAGIATAIELLDQGKRVIVLDRDVPEKFGGLAKWSFGGMFFVDTPQQKRTGIRDSIDLAKKDWYSFAEFEENDFFPKQWANFFIEQSTPSVYHWLKKHQVGFFPIVHWVERGLYTPGNSVPRFHMVWGTGHWLAEALIKRLNHHPQNGKLKILFSHRVDEILQTAGNVSGVKGLCQGKDFEVSSDAVVVASGGVCGSIKRVKENWYKPWGEAPEIFLNGSHPVADGSMHDKVASLGGALTHMDKFWHYAAGVHHPEPQFDGHGLSIVPPKSALWLNYKGERIGPSPLISGFDTRYLVEQICKQEKKYSWQIMNKKIMVKEFAISGSQANEAIKEKNIFKFIKTILLGNEKLVQQMTSGCMDIVVANSLEELVVKMNGLNGDASVSIESVRQTLAAYDDQIDRGPKYHNDDQLRRIAHLRMYRGDKARLCKFQKINDTGAYPLIAIRQFILSRKTLGGIKTDLESRVLANDNQVIPGLYAVGEASGFGGGGIHGKRALEGTFLGACILNGRVAAKSIVGKKIG